MILLYSQIVRLIYANSGSALLALAYNGVHKLWKWQQADKKTPRDVIKSHSFHLSKRHTDRFPITAIFYLYRQLLMWNRNCGNRLVEF